MDFEREPINRDAVAAASRAFVIAWAVFFVLYWGLFYAASFFGVVLTGTELAVARQSIAGAWELLGEEAWRIEVPFYYLGPISAFFGATAVSGVFRAVGMSGRLSFPRIAVFVVVFAILDGMALGFALASPRFPELVMKNWLDSVGNLAFAFHIFIGPAVAVVGTCLALQSLRRPAYQ